MRQRNSITAAVRAELESASKLDTHLGQLAVTLAGRIDAGDDSGGGVAALSRELREVMAHAVTGAAIPGDPLDELRVRRDGKRAG